MNVYMPRLTPLAPQIWRSEQEVANQIERLQSDREAILNYLAEAGKPEPARTAIPELGNHPCCDNPIFEIFCRIFCNPCRVAKDAACGCFLPCLMSTPDNKPYMPEHVYNFLRNADISVNRNTFILCCAAPVVLSSFPFAGFVPLATRKLLWLTSLAGCGANDCGVFSGGCLTYFWSGGFGERELQASRELKVIYDDVADFLKDKWQSAQPEQREPLKQLCEKVRRNSLNIFTGLINGGIQRKHAEDITTKLFTQIYTILKGTQFPAIDELQVRHHASPLAQPLMPMERI